MEESTQESEIVQTVPDRAGTMVGLFETFEKEVEEAHERESQQQSSLPTPRHSSSLTIATIESKKCREWREIFKDLMPPSGIMSDLTIVVGSQEDFVQETFQVHKCVLHLRNRVLSEEIQKLPCDEKVMIIPTMNPMGFKYLISYIYTNELKGIKELEMLPLLDWAAIYDTQDLLPKVLNLLKTRIKIKNVLQVYEKAHSVDYDELKNIAFDFIVKNCDKLFMSETFLTLEVATLQELLSKDGLNYSESDIFEAVVRWATYKIQKRNGSTEEITPALLRAELDPLIPLIRFPLMSAADIERQPSSILTSEELVQVYRYLCAPDSFKPEITSFSVKPRVYDVQCSQKSDTGAENNDNTNGEDEFESGIRILNTWSLNESTSNGCASPGSKSASSCSSSIRSGRRPSTRSSSIVGFNLRSQPIASSSKAAKRKNIDNSVADVPVFPATESCTSLSPTRNAKRTPKKRRLTRGETASDSDQSDEFSMMTCGLPSGSSTIDPWDVYVRRWGKTVDAKKIREITLLDAKTQLNATKVYMPAMEELRLDLNDELEDSFDRFDRLFDVRKYIFFSKKPTKKWKLEELWDMATVISIKVNGVKMLVMDKIEQELTISFRGDCNDIMKGLNKSDHLIQLNLLKTDFPYFHRFPTADLEKVVFYNVLAKSERDLSAFIKKCPKLTSLSSWVVLPSWNESSHVTLDLKDLISNEKLKHLALSKCHLTFNPKQIAKAGLIKLYLDLCFFPANFAANIHILFPNLERVAIRQRKQISRKGLEQDASGGIVTVRMIANLRKIKTLTFIRIWGMDWEERHQNDVSDGKKLRTSLCPITNEEFKSAQEFVRASGLREGDTNFIMVKYPDKDKWQGQKLNELEPKEDDKGFWDLMDQYEYAYFCLHKIYKDYKTFQNCFVPLSIP